MMMAMLSSRKTVSMCSLIDVEKASSGRLTRYEAKAHLVSPCGWVPALNWAPRRISRVTITEVIIPRMTQAGPVCDP